MITVQSSPSLALVKYWGKDDPTLNLPATSSLAIGLDNLKTETTVSLVKADDDRVVVNGEVMPAERYASFFHAIREKYGFNGSFDVDSTTHFPVAAGLASSSSGFAALAFACANLLDKSTPISEISDLARLGSASAARALYSGFTTLKKGSHFANPLYDESHWPELRVLVGIVTAEKKVISSRKAMELAKTTSPYYPQWLEESDKLFDQSLIALENKDINRLGVIMRQSYLKMFATMFTSEPPVLYWQSETIELIHACERLRDAGLAAWETMDAGPQVKVICLADQLEQILSNLKETVPKVNWLISKPGGGTSLKCG